MAVPGGHITLHTSGGIATVRLCHSARQNAMSQTMWVQLKTVFGEIHHRTDLRCVVVQGEGGHFCAGGDIAEYPAFRFVPEKLAHFHETLVWGGLEAMLNCDVPILAAIAGNCMGAGLEIASCCDLRLATPGTRFGAPIARLGFPMAPREAALVSRAVGESTARAMLLAAETVPAQRLLGNGFLQPLVDEAELASHALALAARIAGLAPQAARRNKQTLRALQGPWVLPRQDSAQGMGYEWANNAEHREGIHAFIEKRKPCF